MKMSLFQIIAIVCFLAVGFLTVTPFLPKADASCNYYPESMCDSALEYLTKKINDAIEIRNENGQDSDECKAAKQSAHHAREWASWVCAHADS